MPNLGWAYISGAAAATVGGADTHVQFNSGSTLSGSSNFTYDYTNDKLVLSGGLDVSGTITSYAFETITTTTYLGDTKFGNDTGDTHQFTGSVEISASTLSIDKAGVKTSLEYDADFEGAHFRMTSSANPEEIYIFGNNSILPAADHRVEIAIGGRNTAGGLNLLKLKAGPTETKIQPAALFGMTTGEFKIQGSEASVTNDDGGDIVLIGGVGDGTGATGSIIFRESANYQFTGSVEMSGGNVTIGNAAIFSPGFGVGLKTHSSSFTSAYDQSGDILFAGTGSAAGVAAGHLVYLDSTKQWSLVNAAATGSGDAAFIAIVGDTAPPHSKGVLTRGLCQLTSSLITGSAGPGAFDIGGQVYASFVAGQYTTVIPSGSGEVVRVIGHSIDVDLIFFSPSPDFIEL